MELKGRQRDHQPADGLRRTTTIIQHDRVEGTWAINDPGVGMEEF